MSEANQEENETTVIRIHLKNDSDKVYCYLEKPEKFALTQSGIDSFDNLKINARKPRLLTYSFNLSSPSILGFNGLPFYIEPGTTTDLSFEQFGKNKYLALIQKVGVISGHTNTALIENEPDKEFSNRAKLVRVLLPRLQASLTKMDMEGVLTCFDSLADERLKTVMRNNVNFLLTDKRKHFLKQIFFESFYVRWAIEFTGLVEKKRISRSAPVIDNFLVFNKDVSKRDTVQQYSYFYAQKKIYETFYQPEWQTSEFLLNSLANDLKGYDSVTTQYFNTLLLTDKMNRLDEKVSARVLGSVSIPELAQWIELNQGKDIENLSDVAKGIMVFDTHQQPVSFASLVEKAKQPFIYFNFSGSWCVPCMQETETWSKSNRWILYSEKIKPYWIFFENNLEDWLTVIKKYNLPKENCFVITDNSLQVAFSKNYDWIGEFPHHFLFSSDGNIINRSARGLPDFQEKDLPSKMQKKIHQPTVFPPPG